MAWSNDGHLEVEGEGVAKRATMPKTGDELKDLLDILEIYRSPLAGAYGDVSKKQTDSEIASTKLASTPKKAFTDHFTWIGEGDKNRKATYDKAKSEEENAKKLLVDSQNRLKAIKDKIEMLTQSFLIENDKKFAKNYDAQKQLEPLYKAGKASIAKLDAAVKELDSAISGLASNASLDIIAGQKDDFSRSRGAAQAFDTSDAVSKARSAVESVRSYQMLLSKITGDVGISNLPSINMSVGTILSGGGAILGASQGYGERSDSRGSKAENVLRGVGMAVQLMELQNAKNSLDQALSILQNSDAQISTRFETLDQQRKMRVDSLRNKALTVLEKAQ